MIFKISAQSASAIGHIGRFHDDCGGDQSLYSKYERGERDVPLNIVARLAVYYETGIDQLVGLTDEKTP